MKKNYFLIGCALMVSFLMITNSSKAQPTVFNTVTNKVVSSAGSGTVVFPPVALSSSGLICVNNGWNNTMISSIGKGGGSDYYAQSFIATVSSITKIGIVIQELSPEGQVRFGIAEDNGGVPNYAAPLYMGGVINPTTTAQWYYQDGLNIKVTAGKKYYLLIDGYNLAGTGVAQIGQSNTLPIAGEGLIWSNYKGVGAWSNYGTGYKLAIYVEGNSAPVPVSPWAIALAFVVIGTATIIGIKRKTVKRAI